MTKLGTSFDIDRWVVTIEQACRIASDLPRGTKGFDTLSGIIRYGNREITHKTIIDPHPSSFNSFLRVFALQEYLMAMTADELRLRYLLLSERGQIILLDTTYWRYILGMEDADIPQDVIDGLKFPFVPRDRFAKKYPHLPNLEGKKTVEEATFINIRNCDNGLLHAMLVAPFWGSPILCAITECARNMLVAEPKRESIRVIYEKLEAISSSLFDLEAWTNDHVDRRQKFYKPLGYSPYEKVARATY